MLKDGKDTTYNKLVYYPHYWIKGIAGTACLMRTTNMRDVAMKDEDGKHVSGAYLDMYRLARTLNNRNRERNS